MFEFNNDMKVYGVYPGDIVDTKLIDNMDEIDLFFTIYRTKVSLDRNRQLIYRRKENIDITETEYAINYMMAQTSKFGVKISDLSMNKRILNPSFWDWYKFYLHHFFEVLSNSQLNEFLIKKERGEDISDYLPKSNWNDVASEEKARYRRLKKHNV